MSDPGTVELHRPGRVLPRRPMPQTLSLPSVPSIPDSQGGGAWQVIGPVLGSAGIAGFAVLSGDRRHLTLAAILVGAVLVSGLIGRLVQRRATRRGRRATVQRYLEHLDRIRARLDRSARSQRAADAEDDPSADRLPVIAGERTRVWERRPDHPDFLRVRIGTGPVAAWWSPRLEPSVDPVSLPEPDALAAAEQLVSDTARLGEMAVSVDLGGLGVLAIVAEHGVAVGVARSLVTRLAVFCAPSDLRMAGYVDDPVGWDWIKWLPHLRTGADKTDIAVAATIAELDGLLESIDIDRIEAAAGRSPATASPAPPPGLLLVVDRYDPASAVGGSDRLRRVLEAARPAGILAVCLVSGSELVPAVTDATLTIGPAGESRWVCHAATGERLEGFAADTMDEHAAETTARALAPLRVGRRDGPQALEPRVLSELLDSAVAGRPADGSRNAPGSDLTTPIGVAEDGTPLTLDLREAAAGGMGPHGVVIGATGSGKSELLRTLVLGAAHRNSPEELALVLADFKGGATFAPLSRLPHVAGVISNLETAPALVERMQHALFGELERRQRFLRDAGFDRADLYRAHRREQHSTEMPALPALLVVVDEFGELLASHPDFIELFTSIGRTGRSLGVHLLLASQRLDEGRIRRIDGHLRYRICLRTFTPEESMSVLGTRAAADLPPVPGLGLLAVDGRLTRFRSATVSVGHEPTAGDVGRISVRPFRIDARCPRPPAGSADAVDRTEMTDMVDAVAHGRRTRQVWLDPLPTEVGLEDLVVEGSLEMDTSRFRVPIGRVDRPRDQRQDIAWLDFSGTTGNLAVIGGPRSGKSTLLATLISAAALRYSPADVQFYVVDLGGGVLHELEALPHVGAVFGRSRRREATRVVGRLRRLIDERAEEFRRHGVVDIAHYLAERTEGRLGGPWGRVLLVIDNWAALCRDHGPDLIDEIGEMAAAGLHYGVHVVIAAGRWHDLRPAIRDALAGRLELRLPDSRDSEIDPRSASALAAIPGRGLDHMGRHIQIATASTVDIVDLAAKRWRPAAAAPPIRSLPDRVVASELRPANGGVALGVEEDELACWTVDLFGQEPHFLVLGDGPCGKSNLLSVWIARLADLQVDRLRIAVIDYRGAVRLTATSKRNVESAADPRSAAELVGAIVADHEHRGVGGRLDSGRTVLFVDDYDLVTGPGGGPLDRLAELLPRGRDNGLHVVVARRIGGLARSSFEPVLQRLHDLGTPGLVMNGDSLDGRVLGSVVAQPLPTGRGVHVTRPSSVFVQTAVFDTDASVTRLHREAG